jgi:tripartite-type tricarboxylate transporter receptor subunit TctC
LPLELCPAPDGLTVPCDRSRDYVSDRGLSGICCHELPLAALDVSTTPLPAPLMLADAPTALPYIGSGRIKALAVMAKSRMPAAPDVPTVDEAGLPDFYASLWYGLWAQKNTPDGIIARLNVAAVNALADLTVRKRLADLGQDIPTPAEQTPLALGSRQKAEIEKWWPIMRAANIRAE